MNSEAISKLALYIDENSKDIRDNKTTFDAEKVYEVIDGLEVLRKPVQEYFEMTEDEYYENESDHRLTLQNSSEKIGKLKDRVQVNHVDGSLAAHEINFTYNHEDPYTSGNYNPKIDLDLIDFSLTVIGAVFANTIISDVRNSISNDALLSIGLAAKAIKEWQD
ncbi:hypothetical protein [Companilactobacillus metriopterae]|uniref:hypothetical protein n=1 Tax=Companilactobacillus metriopterae TaxID=1909267 RepID=UPI00100A8938|nr:hypothetical protein [Companilactobacillus metriopterae]